MKMTTILLTTCLWYVVFISFTGCNKPGADWPKDVYIMPFFPNYIVSTSKNFAATKLPLDGEAKPVRDTMYLEYTEPNPVDSILYHYTVKNYAVYVSERISTILQPYDSYVLEGKLKFIVNYQQDSIEKRKVFIFEIVKP